MTPNNTVQPNLDDLSELLAIVVGPSGRGKSTSIEKLDPERTYIINGARKRLPFPDAKKFTNIKQVSEVNDFLTAMDEAAANPKITQIVFDDFSTWLRRLMALGRANRTGWEVMNYYNSGVGVVFDRIRQVNKRFVLIAHDEMIKDGEGVAQKVVKVDGKVWPGVIESTAEVVLYPVMRSKGEGQNEYFFQTQTDGVTPAKTPRGMFKDYMIPNDLQLVFDAMNAYFK